MPASTVRILPRSGIGPGGTGPAEPLRVLVVNVGSQSVKVRSVEHGVVCSAADLGPVDEDLEDHLGDFLAGEDPPDAVGHRVVHGGASFRSATVVDAEVRRRLDSLSELAPLHNPPALVAIDVALR